MTTNERTTAPSPSWIDRSTGSHARPLVVISTFIFDAEGTPCVTFDAEPHLENPLTAFVAGDLTTSTGNTGPSLVYLDTGGKVVAYHGLLEQVKTTCPKFSRVRGGQKTPSS